MITSNYNNNYDDSTATGLHNLNQLNELYNTVQYTHTANTTVNQLYNTIQYTHTTNTTDSTVWEWETVYTNYVPFQNQYVYDTGFQWKYTADIIGLREYMFANNLYKELSDILYDLYLITTDEQDFEDSLYRNTLDLIYEFTRPEPAFNDLLNEDIFDYRSLNKIISEVIEAYRSNFETEEF